MEIIQHQLQKLETILDTKYSKIFKTTIFFSLRSQLNASVWFQEVDPAFLVTLISLSRILKSILPAHELVGVGYNTFPFLLAKLILILVFHALECVLHNYDTGK